MTFKNRQLFVAAKAYVKEGLKLLSTRCTPEHRLALERTEWVPSGAQAFVRRTRPELSWSLCVDRNRDALHALTEYTEFINMLRVDVVIAPQLDNLVGSPFQQGRLETSTIADGLITRVADEAGGFDFLEDFFAAIYSEVEQALYAADIEHITVAPVPNLASETLPISFDESIAIDALTDEEIGICAAAGLLRPPFGDFGMIHMESKCGLRSVVRLPKVIGGLPAAPRPDLPDLREPISGAMLAVRLCKGTRIHSPGYVTYSKNWLVRGGRQWWSTPVHLRHPPMYMLSAGEVESLVRLWRAARSEGVRNRGALGGALRRFEYAGERYRPEDRLVDLMIAAESLFLEDAGDPQSRGELRYRLAIRSAFFIDMPSRSRRQVFDLMRRAYDTRSKVVHGNVPLTVALPGEALSLEEFTDTVEDHFRTALTKAIEIAEQRPQGATLVAWDDLILGPT